MLNRNEIHDLSPLSELKKLQTLRLRINLIQDVLPLVDLVKLEQLWISGNPLTTTAPLAALPNLTDIDVEISEETVVSILDESLAAAVREALTLEEDAAITDAAMLELTTLWANTQSPKIRDITGLEYAVNLETLSVGENYIEDIQPLEGLTNLTTLWLHSNWVRNIEPLEGLTNLTTLWLGWNKITDVSPLAGLVNLTHLNLAGNPNLKDLSPLLSIKDNLEAVDVEITAQVVSVPDASLAAAIRRTLTLEEDAAITDAAMLELTTLWANTQSPKIRDITGLEYAVNLETLSVGENYIEDIQPLEGLTNLTTLWLHSNWVRNIEPLEELTNLKTLWLGWNKITDVSPLAGLVNLTHLNLAGNPNLKDLSPLLSIRDNLEAVDVDIPEADTQGAPSGIKFLDREALKAQLKQLRAESDGSLKYQWQIQWLENLLAATRPDETRLLANYPNPFNPETWIPYQLAKPSTVRITIYNAQGSVVRELDFGHQAEGYHTDRNRAAYWDGRNAVGERVASGVYFYTLRAGDFHATRKMLILK
jgi:internalin A